MAVAFGTIATASGGTNGDGSAGSNSLTITKPTSTAEGDLLIAYLAGHGSDANEWSLSGWTLVTETGISAKCHETVLVKVAGGSEPANYTFIQTNQGNDDAQGGAILRFTGSSFAGSGNFDAASATSNSGTSHTWVGGATAQSTNTIWVMAMFGIDAQTTWSGQAITNDDPAGGWTERWDTAINVSGVDGGICVATADADAATASGDFSATSSGTVVSAGVLIAVDESTNVSVTGSTKTFSSPGQVGSVTGDANVTLDAVDIDVTPKAPTITTAASKYSNTSKSTESTWTNTDKS